MNGRGHSRRIGRASLTTLALALAVLCWPGAAEAARISLNGTSGLLMTPTADLATDREIVAGVSFIEKKWAVEMRGEHDNIAYFATLGYLPRVEVSMRLTVMSGAPFSQEDPDRSVKDRMLSVKALILREDGMLPSVAVGGEDLTGTKRFNSLFAVAAKHLDLGRAGELGLHLGAGADWMDAKNHPLAGVFGGLTKSLWEGGEFLAEYDTDKVNVGLGIEPFPFVRLLVSALNVESFAGMVHFQFTL